MSRRCFLSLVGTSPEKIMRKQDVEELQSPSLFKSARVEGCGGLAGAASFLSVAMWKIAGSALPVPC